MAVRGWNGPFGAVGNGGEAGGPESAAFWLQVLHAELLGGAASKGAVFRPPFPPKKGFLGFFFFCLLEWGLSLKTRPFPLSLWVGPNLAPFPSTWGGFLQYLAFFFLLPAQNGGL